MRGPFRGYGRKFFRGNANPEDIRWMTSLESRIPMQCIPKKEVEWTHSQPSCRRGPLFYLTSLLVSSSWVVSAYSSCLGIANWAAGSKSGLTRRICMLSGLMARLHSRVLSTVLRQCVAPLIWFTAQCEVGVTVPPSALPHRANHSIRLSNGIVLCFSPSFPVCRRLNSGKILQPSMFTRHPELCPIYKQRLHYTAGRCYRAE